MLVAAIARSRATWRCAADGAVRGLLSLRQRLSRADCRAKLVDLTLELGDPGIRFVVLAAAADHHPHHHAHRYRFVVDGDRRWVDAFALWALIQGSDSMSGITRRAALGLLVAGGGVLGLGLAGGYLVRAALQLRNGSAGSGVMSGGMMGSATSADVHLYND